MHPINLRGSFTALSLLITLNLFAHVELDNPVGGETFTHGQPVNIQWHIAIPHQTLNWDLFLSTDGGATWEPIQMNIPAGQLSFQWYAPTIETTQARVSVIMDNEGVDYQDESLNFSIGPSNAPALITQAQNLTIQCGTSNQEDQIVMWLDNNGGASASGICGNLVWSNNYTGISNGCGLTGNAIVTFTATDDCGSTETSATLAIIDSTTPSITLPSSDVILECDGNGNQAEITNWLANRGGAGASEACGNVTWTNNYTGISDACAMTGNATVIFTASDECGNSVSTTSTLQIGDTVAPSINSPSTDIVIDCETQDVNIAISSWLSTNGGAIASDQCGNISWSNDFPVITDTCGQTQSFAVVFTATDECGSSSSITATMTILGNTITSINTTTADQFKVFPNPAEQYLTLVTADPKTINGQVDLYDAYGNLVLSTTGSMNELQIAVDMFASGIYFLHINTGKFSFAKKIIIN